MILINVIVNKYTPNYDKRKRNDLHLRRPELNGENNELFIKVSRNRTQFTMALEILILLHNLTL